MLLRGRQQKGTDEAPGVRSLRPSPRATGGLNAEPAPAGGGGAGESEADKGEGGGTGAALPDELRLPR